MTLPYERIVSSSQLSTAFRLEPGESILVLQPFGWHLDGKHIPNAPEQYSMEGLCQEHHWVIIARYGGYLAIIRKDRRKGDRRKGVES